MEKFLHVSTNVGDSIDEVYCKVAVKLSCNITAHALIERFFICNVEVKFSPDFITLKGFNFDKEGLFF